MEWKSLGHLVESAAERFGEKPLFIFEDKPLSFAEVNRAGEQDGECVEISRRDEGRTRGGDAAQRRGLPHRLVCAGEVGRGHRACQHQLPRP